MSLLSLAMDPNTQHAVLTILSTCDNWEIRTAVASNPSTPNETLRLLASDEYVVVRNAVYANSSYTVK